MAGKEKSMVRVEDPFKYIKRQRTSRDVNNSVIFFDIVGFTKETTVEEMKYTIRHIEDSLNDLLEPDYYWHETNKQNDLILIPTGDGYAIGFHPTKFPLEKILSIAVSIFQKITASGKVKIRMGIAKGPNIVHRDLNDHNNLFGFGINIASRVMGLALDNQIIVHGDFAEEILKMKKVDGLTLAGTYKIKHDDTVIVYNYCKDKEFGNSEIPQENMMK